MTLRDLRNVCYGGALLTWAFAGLASVLQRDLPQDVFLYAAKAGGVFLVIALCIELMRRWVERDEISKLFEAIPVKRGELAEARTLSAKFVPQVPALEQLQAIFEASRRCVWFVDATARSAGGKKSRRVGFFSLIKLTEPAVNLFSRNGLDGFRLDRTHIAGPRGKAIGLYIGGLGARGVRAKGWLVQHVRARIDQFFESGGRVVFARPVTEDGLRIAIGMGFGPAVAGQDTIGNIFKLDSPFD